MGVKSKATYDSILNDSPVDDDIYKTMLNHITWALLYVTHY